MAWRTARRLVVRGRPTGRAAGRTGPTRPKPRRSGRRRRIECSSYGLCGRDQRFFKTNVDFSNMHLVSKHLFKRTELAQMEGSFVLSRSTSFSSGHTCAKEMRTVDVGKLHSKSASPQPTGRIAIVLILLGNSIRSE